MIQKILFSKSMNTLRSLGYLWDICMSAVSNLHFWQVVEPQIHQNTGLLCLDALYVLSVSLLGYKDIYWRIDILCQHYTSTNQRKTKMYKKNQYPTQKKKKLYFLYTVNISIRIEIKSFVQQKNPTLYKLPMRCEIYGHHIWKFKAVYTMLYPLLFFFSFLHIIIGKEWIKEFYIHINLIPRWQFYYEIYCNTVLSYMTTSRFL